MQQEILRGKVTKVWQPKPYEYAVRIAGKVAYGLGECLFSVGDRVKLPFQWREQEDGRYIRYIHEQPPAGAEHPQMSAEEEGDIESMMEYLLRLTKSIAPCELPTFQGYIVAFRLKEFRRLEDGKLEFVPFNSPKGEKLYKEMKSSLGAIVDMIHRYFD